MKIKLLAITLFVIGAFIACKKVAETINPKYTDTELKIDPKSAFAIEERKIKEGVMNFDALTKKERKAILDGIIMDNKNVTHIGGNTMPIFEKMKMNDVINLYKILIPNSNFTIMDNDRIIATHHSDWLPCEHWVTYWHRYYGTYEIEKCVQPGNTQCFRYVPCNE
jgi:hypothetical protein